MTSVSLSVCLSPSNMEVYMFEYQVEAQISRKSIIQQHINIDIYFD